MNINTQNYEQFFIDFIEGNLNAFEEKELRNFVQLHPELQAEFDELNHLILQPEDVSYAAKNLLKENPVRAIPGISKTERLSIAFLENELSEKEKAELKQLQSNPKNQKTFQLIQKSKLVPEKIEYPYKNRLKRKVTGLFVFRKEIFYRAAALVLLFIALNFWFGNKQKVSVSRLTLIRVNDLPVRTIVSNKQIGEKSMPEKQNPVFEYKISPKNNQENLKKQDADELPFLSNIKPEKLIVRNNSDEIDIPLYPVNQQTVDYKNLKDDTNKKTLKYFTHQSLFALKKVGKTVVYGIVYSMRKNIKYQKQYIDEDKVLIALKAGDFEYKKVKYLKKP